MGVKFLIYHIWELTLQSENFKIFLHLDFAKIDFTLDISRKYLYLHTVIQQSLEIAEIYSTLTTFSKKFRFNERI